MDGGRTWSSRLRRWWAARTAGTPAARPAPVDLNASPSRHPPAFRDDPVALDLLRSIRGSRLTGVEYTYLDSGDGAPYEMGYPGADEMETVALRFAELGVVTVAWASPVPEGMVVGAGHLYRSRGGNSVLDAADREMWRPYLGCRVEEVAVAWADAWNYPRVPLWALRLKFRGGSVVLALAEHAERNGRPPELDVHPTSVVAIHSESLARGLHLFPGGPNAWGEALPPGRTRSSSDHRREPRG